MTFPVSPSNNDIAIINGIRYVYSSTTNSWTRLISSGKFTAAASAPTNPAPGDQWYDSSDNILFYWVNDGLSSFWLDVSTSTTYTNATVTGSQLSITGNASMNHAFIGNITLSGNIIGSTSIAGSITPTANLSYNLGSPTKWWGTFYGVSTQAKYADLAENYTADANYESGTVVVFGGSSEVTVTTISHDARVAGVISTNPAYLMNASITGLPVALAGRVPCFVQGPVTKGEILVTSGIPGVAKVLEQENYKPGCIIGKSLDTIETTEIRKIEIVVGRI